MDTKNVTPSPHAEEAKVLLDKIRALRAEIPRLASAGLERLNQFNGTNIMSDGALESTSVAVQTFSVLESAAGVEGGALRDRYHYAVSHDPVVHELYTLARDMDWTVRSQRAEAAAIALDVFAVAKRLSKRADGAALVPHVEDISRKLSGGRPRRKSDPAPAPTAQTASPASK